MRTFAAMVADAFARRSGTIRRQLRYSPFSFGRCAFPLFATNDEVATGLGTGFLIEGCDLAITAEHLMDVASIDMPRRNDLLSLDLSQARHSMTALLPMNAVVFGKVTVPPAYCQPVSRFLFDVVDDDDPLLELRGKQRFVRRSDILFIEFPAGAALPASGDRPQLTCDVPVVGDWVCAVGYPDIDLVSAPDDALEMVISDLGMAVSFARVTAIALEGRTRRETAPVVFVESDWPGGMSGGPVFDLAGRVVGVVSRELVTQMGEPGRGSFTLLSRVLERSVQDR